MLAGAFLAGAILKGCDQGTFQVAVGGVYSFYEFWQDESNRLTDEEWRAMLVAGTEPARPAWQEVLFAD